MQRIWHIRLFGSLGVHRGDDSFSRFSTRKTGALLAFLAFHPDQGHGREALCELLWPGEDAQTSRARLRVALTSLRHQLEPPGVPPGSVIRSDSGGGGAGGDAAQVALSGEAVSTDVAEVEAALRVLADPAAREGTPGDAHVAAGGRVVARFREPLLTGFYEDWVTTERERLTRRAVERLSALAGRVPPEAGLEWARHAARLDPLAEEPLFALLSLLAAGGQHPAARRAFDAFRRRLEADLGDAPSPELCALAASLPEARDSLPRVAPAPPAAPPPRDPPAWPRRLPSYRTRFFGRERERRELRLALREASLVTVTGPGGVGKTRLAVETTRAWEGEGFFVPLADVTAPVQIPAAICDALGERAERAADGPDARLARAADVLSRMTSPLLVLDNLEQVADDAGSLLLKLLERAPGLRLLVTSRLRAHLPGEREFPLLPLPLPPENDDAPAGGGYAGAALEEAARMAAVALFLDRARAARPDFQITARNGGDVVSVCRMLEGMPLAIELVAAWGGTLAPARMREELARRGSLGISDRRADAGYRHRSLYAAIDWSYRLLPPELGRFFARLSVFRGGFTAEAAAAVTGDGEAAAGEALARLRAHSLLASLDDAPEMRFTLLESLRTFGAEHLTGDEQAAAGERHAAWCARLAERFHGANSGAELGRWLERIDAELPNVRAAMERDLPGEDPARALRTAGALGEYWNLRGRPTEGRAWLGRALAACPAPPVDAREDADARSRRARALHGAGTLAVTQGDGTAARPLYEESLRLRRALGDRAGVASSLNNLGLLALSRQEWDAARALLDESLALRREDGDPADLAGSLLNLGVVDFERGDPASAEQRYEEALALFRAGGDRAGEGRALNNLGGVALSRGDFAAAEAWYERSLAVKRVVGHREGVAVSLSNVGVAALYQGRYAIADACFEEALAVFRELDAPLDVADQLRNLAQTATYRGEWNRAFSLLSESLALVRRSDTPDDIAGTLEGFALLSGARGDAGSVPRLLGAADAVRLRTGCPLYPSERVAPDRADAAARAALGGEGYDRAFRDGAGLSPDAAAALALSLAPPR